MFSSTSPQPDPHPGSQSLPPDPLCLHLHLYFPSNLLPLQDLPHHPLPVRPLPPRIGEARNGTSCLFGGEPIRFICIFCLQGHLGGRSNNELFGFWQSLYFAPCFCNLPGKVEEGTSGRSQVPFGTFARMLKAVLCWTSDGSIFYRSYPR